MIGAVVLVALAAAGGPWSCGHGAPDAQRQVTEITLTSDEELVYLYIYADIEECG